MSTEPAKSPRSNVLTIAPSWRSHPVIEASLSSISESSRSAILTSDAYRQPGPVCDRDAIRARPRRQRRRRHPRVRLSTGGGLTPALTRTRRPGRPRRPGDRRAVQRARRGRRAALRARRRPARRARPGPDRHPGRSARSAPSPTRTCSRSPLGSRGDRRCSSQDPRASRTSSMTSSRLGEATGRGGEAALLRRGLERAPRGGLATPSPGGRGAGSWRSSGSTLRSSAATGCPR